MSYVRCLLLRSTFAATAPRSAVAELEVVRRFCAHRVIHVKKSSKIIAGLLALFVCIPFGRWVGAVFSEPERRLPSTWLYLLLFGSLVLSAVCLAAGAPSARNFTLGLHAVVTVRAAIFTYECWDSIHHVGSLQHAAGGHIGVAWLISTTLAAVATLICIGFLVWLLRLDVYSAHERSA